VLTKWLERRLQSWLEGVRTGNPAQAKLAFDWATPARTQRVLHVGCGQAQQLDMPGEFAQTTWQEIRLDGDAAAQPHIVASMSDMSVVPDGAVDAVYSSHGIEHLYWHEVPLAFAEFHSVIADDGFLVVTCPDLQAAAQMIAEDKLFEPAYESPAGTITPFDIVYSYRPFVEKNPQWMAHHCGYTLSTLVAVLRQAGFSGFFGFRRPSAFDLWVLATPQACSEDTLRELANRFLPGVE